MAPVVVDLSDDQRFALMKLRRNVAQLAKPENDDFYLLRWLRARDFDVEAAEKMLRDSLEWRSQWNVDSLQTWEPPEILKEYYPSGLSGYDKEGSPVVIVPFAGLDMWGMMHSVRKSDFIRHTLKMIEWYLQIAMKQVKQCGPQASKVILILDMDKFNLRQYAWRPAAEVIITLIQMYEANYPEALKAAYVINAPKVFSIAYSVVKNFLKEYTLSKIQIFKNDPRKWQPALLAVIPANQLPAYYGGTMTDSDGNPKCPSIIHPGGKIPKSLYHKKDTASRIDDSTTVVIKKGDKLTLPCIAVAEGCSLQWEFRSEGHDIKFGITCTNMDGQDSVVVPVQRIACHQTAEKGTIICKEPATYTVIFDNSYSIMRNKTIHYSISMRDPPEAADEEQAALQDGCQLATHSSPITCCERSA